jgi:hypothetical protein
MANSIVFGLLSAAISGVCALVICPASSGATEISPVRTIERYVDKPSVLVFHDGSRFETTLFEVRVLGVLRTQHKAPYLVLARRGCTECDCQHVDLHPLT